MNAPYQIMIVEDDPLLCELLIVLLNENGYKALSAVSNYEDAKKQLLEQEPDLALVDITLQGKKDGIELATYIYEHTHIPVVFMTGRRDAVTLQRAKKSHAHSVVLKTKPLLDERGMLDTIAEQLLASIHFASSARPLREKIRSRGLLLKAAERIIEPLKHNHNGEATNEGQIKKETFIEYDDIEYIAANNKDIKNTILIKLAGKKGFICRETLDNIEKELPDHFVKIRDSQIINIKKITQCIEDRILYINEETYPVLDEYRKEVNEKKRLYMNPFTIKKTR